MSTELLAQAFATTRGVLANVKPEQLDAPTPCASWNVRELVNHVVGGSHWFATTVEAGTAAPPAETDWSAGNVLASYDEGITASLAAFGAPGAMEKILKLPFGELPGAVFMGLATSDQFTHGWDLARATGQSSDLSPELAAALLEQVKPAIPDQFRGPDGQAPFGLAVEAGASATAADRLAAFLGRQP